MKFILSFLIFCMLGSVTAQDFNASLSGIVQDSASGNGIEYATIKLYNTDDSMLVSGVASEATGSFVLKSIPAGNYYAEISFFGYEPFFIHDIQITPPKSNIDLGNISLAPKSMVDLVIKGDQPFVTYEIDKKVINVEDQHTNVGQTAAEVLANAPSVSVDGDGNVVLRGSGDFTLLINGVPTAMDPSEALRTIPASTIRDIEIITNPSARYDAEGTVGIINVITKKNKLEGISLLTNLNYGTYDNYGGDVNMSFGKEKFTLNLTANVNNRSRPRDIDKSRTTFYDSAASRILSNGEGAWTVFSRGIKGDAQWQPNDKHTLVFGGDLNLMEMRPHFYLFFEEYKNDLLVNSYENRQENIIDIFALSTSLFYQYKPKGTQDHSLTIKAINNQKFVNQINYARYYNSSSEQTGGTRYREVGPTDFIRFDADYIRPIKKNKLELGGRVQLGNSTDDGDSFYYDAMQDDYVHIDSTSSDVDYTRDIYAAYSMVSGQRNNMMYQLGLRSEYTYRTIGSTNFGDFDTIQRLDWFPTAHFSFNLKKKRQFLISYSRRIQRPRSWYFEPFITWESEFNVRTGNPNLTPEYINNFEASWITPLKGDKGYFTIEGYFRLLNGKIERVSTVYRNNILMTRPYNIGESQSIGIEPSVNYDLKKWWKLNAAANFFFFNVKGSIDDIIYDNSSFNYAFRVTNTFKFKKGWTVQLVKSYESESATAQGRELSSFDLQGSIRKSVALGKYSFTLSGRNILGTVRDHEIIEGPNLLLIRHNTPKFPMVTFTFTMRLNNYKQVAERHEEADDF